MAIDTSSRPYDNRQDEQIIFLRENLTTFLTELFPTKRRKVIDKCIDVILALYSRQNFEWHAAGIAAYYGKDRRYYSDHIKLLVSKGIIAKKQKIDGFVPLILNHNVVKHLKKIERGIGSYVDTKLSRRKIKNKLSEKSADIRAHRIMATFTHSLSSYQFAHLKKHYGFVNGRVKSDIVFEDKHYVLLWFKDKVQIYSPVYYGNTDEWSVISSEINVDLGRLTAYLERYYTMPARMKLLDKRSFVVVDEQEKELTHAIRKEYELQHPFFVYVNDRIQEQYDGPVIRPDFKSMPGYLGIEGNEGYRYDGCSREGKFDVLFEDLLYFPQHYHRYFTYTNNHIDNATGAILQTVDRVEQKIDTLTDKIDSLDYELADLKQQNEFAHEYLRQQQDVVQHGVNKLIESETEIIRGLGNLREQQEFQIERLREELQLLQTGMLEQFSIKLSYISHFEKKCKEILEHLQDGEKSYLELAKRVGITQAALSRYVNYLEKEGLIVSYRKKTGGRGRARRIFKLNKGVIK